MSIFLVSPCHAHIHNSRSIPMNGCFDCVHCAYGGLAKTIYLRSIYEVFFLADQATLRHDSSAQRRHRSIAYMHA